MARSQPFGAHDMGSKESGKAGRYGVSGYLINSSGFANPPVKVSRLRQLLN